AFRFASFKSSVRKPAAAVNFVSKSVLRVFVTFEYSVSSLTALTLVTDPLINCKKINLKIKASLFFKLN
ncbi:hypothetical protein MSGX11T_02215, partial [Mycoplasma synoviae GX11-T]|nr:hypothetical protein [Mycoplasmopsis synoviae GX11-T]